VVQIVDDLLVPELLLGQVVYVVLGGGSERLEAKRVPVDDGLVSIWKVIPHYSLLSRSRAITIYFVFVWLFHVLLHEFHRP